MAVTTSLDIYEEEAKTVRIPYFSIQIAGTNLTPIPPKYIKSLNVDRLRSGVSASFTMQIVAPINPFTKGSDYLGLELVRLLGQNYTQSAKEEDYNDINFTYGWKNGSKLAVTGGKVTKFSFDYSDGEQFITYTIGGECEKIRPTLFSTEIYSLMNEKISDEAETNIGSVTKLSGEEGSNQVSDIIENLAKYLFKGFDISVEHTDRTYGAETALTDITVDSFTQWPDKSSVTAFEYLKALVRGCRVWEPTPDEHTSSLDGRQFYGDLPVVDINGEKYTVGSDNSEEIKSALTYNPSGSSKYVYPFEGVTTDNVTITIDGTSQTVKLEKVDSANITDLPKSYAEGSYGNYYKLRIDPYKKILRVFSSNTSTPKIYTISNNHDNKEVISFSVSSDGLPAISAASAVNQDSGAGVDVESGGAMKSSSNLGGLVPLNEAKNDSLMKNYKDVLASTISNNTSKATLVVWGSATSVTTNLADTCFRILPMINNGETFWCGDYWVDGISDTIDGDGFKTTFSLKFGKSKFLDGFEENASNAGTSK